MSSSRRKPGAHIPHKHQLIAQAARVAKRGGVIAFTDIVSVGTLEGPTAQRLFDGMRFSEIASRESYCNLLEAAGCVVEQCVALDAEWTRILQQRHAMYRSPACLDGGEIWRGRAIAATTMLMPFLYRSMSVVCWAARA